jgi:hypothetical protein
VLNREEPLAHVCGGEKLSSEFLCQTRPLEGIGRTQST